MLKPKLWRAKHQTPSDGTETAGPFPQGILCLADPPNATVDIVFVHGLTGDRERTWSSCPEAVLWPQALLASRLPHARIMTFGYDAYIVRPGLVSTNRIGNHSMDLLQALVNLRTSHGIYSRPIVFVAHSLGGLVTKDALLLSKNSPEGYLRSIFSSTKAIAFMGTPHLGSALATWAKLPTKWLGFLKQTNMYLLSVLETESETLSRIQRDFLTLLRVRESQGNPISITCFYETMPSPAIGMIVSQESAILPGYNHISIHADHRGMTKFATPSDPGFVSVVGELERWISELAGSSQDPSQLDDLEARCIQYLAYSDMESRQYAIDDPADETCEWLFQNLEYRDWMGQNRPKDSHGLLWIKGKPGSEKSTMMKHAFVKAKADAAAGKFCCLGFFFNARGATLEKSPAGLYQSLLHQLLLQCVPIRKEFASRFKEKETQFGVGKASWHFSEIRSFFHWAITRREAESTRIFIDALDECDDEEVRQVVSSFEVSAAQAVSKKLSLYICWSSRHYPHISISHGLELRMEDLNSADISLYVHRQLASCKYPDLADFETQIVQRASGVFLWTNLVIQRLRKAADQGRSKAEMRAILSRLPSKLDDLFHNIFVSIDLQERAKTIQLMRWILFSGRPLSLRELRVALALSSGSQQLSSFESLHDSEHLNCSSKTFERFLVDVSAGLCEVVSQLQSKQVLSWEMETRTVQVIHESVRDFFLGESGYRYFDHRSPNDLAAHSQQFLFYACRNYICMPDFSRYPPWSHMDVSRGMASIKRSFHFPEYPSNYGEVLNFWDYAIQNVFHHAEQAEAEGLFQQKSLFQPLLLNWVSICGQMDASTLGEGKLRWGLSRGKFLQAEVERSRNCREGLHCWLSAMLRRNKVCLARQPGYMLAAGAHSGWDNTILRALKGGASVDEMMPVGHCALHEAAAMGHVSAARALKFSGASLEARDMSGKTALFNAATTGGLEMVRLLIHLGAEVDARDDYGTTPLIEAARAGQSGAVEALLAAGAGIEKRDGFAQTALSIASAFGNDSVVLLLIGWHASLETMDKEGDRPLAKAARYGHLSIMKIVRAMPLLAIS